VALLLIPCAKWLSHSWILSSQARYFEADWQESTINGTSVLHSPIQAGVFTNAGGALIAGYVPPAQTLSGYVVGGGLEWAQSAASRPRSTACYRASRRRWSHWITFKNPAAPAVKRKAEQNWS
jgi:hypothetical protein